MSADSVKDKLQAIHVPTQTTAYFADLNNYSSEIDLALEGIEDLRKSHSEEVKLNVRAAYMSPWDSLQFTPKLYPLLRVVMQHIYAASKLSFNVDFLATNFKLRAFQCWTAVYEQGDETLFHNHFPADFASIVYLRMDGGAAPIVLNQSIECKVASKSLLFFQGHVNHHVPKTEGARYIMVSNFYKLPITVPTYQDPYLEGL